MTKPKVIPAMVSLALFTLAVACSSPGNQADAGMLPPATATPALLLTRVVKDTPINPNKEGYPANWWVGQLEALPSPARVGQAVQVWVNIYVTDIPTSFINAYLEINGQVVAKQQLVVVFDDSTPFSFTFTPDKPGTFELSVRTILAENEASANPAFNHLFVSAYGNLVVTG
jgi:hypothetical protein